MFSDRNMHIVARLAAPKDTGKTGASLLCVGASRVHPPDPGSTCIVGGGQTGNNVRPDGQQCAYFFQKTLPIPENANGTCKHLNISCRKH